MKSLAQWLDEIEAGHPTEIDMGLSRCEEVACALNIQFSDAIVVTVAGTNGKGTTCRLIEQACIDAGFSVGVYSSPHLLDFNERIRINGVNAEDFEICSAFESITLAKQSTSLTYFEYATLAAMYLFNAKKLNIVILEVGLGGRLDATNIIDADINILTTIALDHQDYLGDTTDDIAREKAGIVKANKSTVIGFRQLYAKAEQWISSQNNRILRRGQDFSHNRSNEGHNASISYLGKEYKYQWQASDIPGQNVITAIAGLWFLATEAQNRSGLSAHGNTLNSLLANESEFKRIIDTTSLNGRAQLVCQQPIIMLDVAHNEASADYLVEKIQGFNFTHCHFVVGMLKDKNIEDTLRSLSEIEATWYCATLAGKRGEVSERLLRALPEKNASGTALEAYAYNSVETAISSAIKQVSNTDMIVIVGSFVTVAQAMQYLKQHPL